jgi:hypothetical protein
MSEGAALVCCTRRLTCSAVQLPIRVSPVSRRYFQDTPSTTSSVLYFLYWFLFEFGCTGFAMLFTHAGPSAEAFVTTVKYAFLWASLAGGVKVRIYGSCSCSRQRPCRRCAPCCPRRLVLLLSLLGGSICVCRVGRTCRQVFRCCLWAGPGL